MRPTYAPYETTLLTPEMTVLLVETHESDVDIGAGRTVKVSRIRVLADGRRWWLAAHDVELIDEAG